jgi:hypothetical protein
MPAKMTVSLILPASTKCPIGYQDTPFVSKKMHLVTLVTTYQRLYWLKFVRVATWVLPFPVR